MAKFNDGHPLARIFHIVSPTKLRIPFCVALVEQNSLGIAPFPKDASNLKPNRAAQQFGREQDRRDCLQLKWNNAKHFL